MSLVTWVNDKTLTGPTSSSLKIQEAWRWFCTKMLLLLSIPWDLIRKTNTKPLKSIFSLANLPAAVRPNIDHTSITLDVCREWAERIWKRLWCTQRCWWILIFGGKWINRRWWNSQRSSGGNHGTHSIGRFAENLRCSHYFFKVLWNRARWVSEWWSKSVWSTPHPWKLLFCRWWSWNRRQSTYQRYKGKLCF